jgi:hypothetical protein
MEQQYDIKLPSVAKCYIVSEPLKSSSVKPTWVCINMYIHKKPVDVKMQRFD